MIKIIGVTTTYNVAEKIPYVMPYYERMEIDKLIIYDNYSTDNTVELLSKYTFVEIRYYKTDSFDDNVILNIKNNVWKEYKDEYDWCIVSDFDEVLYSRERFKDVLKRKSNEGKTYLDKIALNLISQTFPPINDKLIHENISYGTIWDCDDCFYQDSDGEFRRKGDELIGVYGNKVILFDIKNTDINYNMIGAHNCHITNNKPFDDDISFFHIKFIDYNYIISNSKQYGERMTNSIRYNYFLNKINDYYKRSELKSTNIDYYIDTPGKLLYPSTLLLFEYIENTEDGINKLNYFSKFYDTSVFYFMSVIFYSDKNFNIQHLYDYGITKNIKVFGDVMPTYFIENENIINHIEKYKYYFNECFTLKNPWIIYNNPKMLENIGKKDFYTYLENNKDKEYVYYDNIKYQRYNHLIKNNHSSLGCYLIVKNEENNIINCLNNLSKVCDEIVVVDTGSTDKTIEYIKNFPNVRLEYFTWINDFSAARNKARSFMKSEYIFTIDADELLTENLIVKLTNLKSCNFLEYNSINMFIELDQNRFYLGGRQIVKNLPEVTWKYKVHEKLYYDESNDLVLNEPGEYIIHRPKSSTSNYNKYAEIYYDEINKGNILNDYNTAHYFYYLFFTLKDIDPFIAKKYLYNCFMLDKIKSNTENQGYNLWDFHLINNDDFYVNSLIGGYQDPKMIMQYINNKITDDITKYAGLKWCYDNGAVFNETDYINLSYISYQYGLFKDFVKYTEELLKKYPNSEIGNNNFNFIQNTLFNLNNYNLIIDFSEGANCISSTIHLMSQYFDEIYLKFDNCNNIPQDMCYNNGLKSITIIHNSENINNDKKNLIINGNYQHDRIYIKNTMQNLIYGKEPNENLIYIKKA